MNPTHWFDELAVQSRPWARRRVVLLGGLIVAAIVGLAIFDTWRSYRQTIDAIGRELESQARVIAEQTARSVQALDVVLRHLTAQHASGAFDAMNPLALHDYLREQSVGLVQTDGLVVFGPDGGVRAVSVMPSGPVRNFNVANQDPFKRLRDATEPGVVIGQPAKSPGTGHWVFPIGRRLSDAQGNFAGAVGAAGRIDYFQQFYRDAYPDVGTRVALLRNDAMLLARHPPADASLGRSFPLAQDLLVSAASDGSHMVRGVSPIDGADRFAVVRRVPEYPLLVVVTRDAHVALASWREQAINSVLRTLALAALAALLMAVVLRQLRRLQVARASLETSRERFAVAVAGSDDGIWDWDYRTDIAFGSARAREIVGLAPGPEEQTMAEWDAQLATRFHPDDLPRRRQTIDDHLAGRTPAYAAEFRVQDGHGGWRWIRARGTCVRGANGRPLRMAGSVSDIDAARRAEDLLRQSEERFQLAVDGANQGLWDWDLRSDLLFLSPRAQTLNFVEPGPTLRPRPEWVALTEYHPDDRARVRAAIGEHLRGGSAALTIEYRVRHHSGGWRWVRQRGLALRDAAGKPYRMAGSMEDISAPKDAEAERDRLEQQLRQAQKLEAIGTLAGGIAHDFNNILSAILGYGELAQKDAAEGTRLRRHLDAANAAALRAKSLVERILAFSRSGVGERVPVHVQSVVAEALDGVAASLPPGVVLQRRLGAGDAGVLGDPTQIHQVVMNLCANAVQAMRSEGSLRVAVDTVQLESSLTVATSVLAPGGYLRLAVADTGSGIAPHVLERIFDPFFTTKEIGVGTGLGLSLVHGIVTDLGGGIAIESAEGQGATFTVYLPSHGVAAPPAAQPATVPPGSGETVLLVDDEEALVRLGEELLAELGYEPVGFVSSRAALQAFEAEPDRFQAVLSDEAMPSLTGTELAAAVRRLRPALPVVLMSGYVSAALLARAKDAGVSEVVGKPLASGDIARALAQALRPSPR